ncbi:hypothetical protein C0J52_13554 [Blattella germanica]|nr:hypothetical protein C0J52_13554 [Blattella germanica]
MLVSATESYKNLMEEIKMKRLRICEEFYIVSDAMVNRNWMETNFALRRILTGLAVHGFNFKI